MTNVFSKKKKKKDRVRSKNEVKSEKNSKRKSCGICPRTRVHSCGGEGPGIPMYGYLRVEQPT